MDRTKENTLLLNAEIQNVLTALRKAPKWALIPRRYSDEEEGDDALLDDFKALRRKAFTWTDWSTVEPSVYLDPFLDVVRSPEVSGPVTGVALTSLHRMIAANVFGDSPRRNVTALQSIAKAVTECKYMSSDPASEESVLFKILHVLLAVVKAPAGKLLPDDLVVKIFEACYLTGQLQSEGGKSLLVMSQQTMHEFVSIIFSRLHGLAAAPGGDAAGAGVGVSPHKLHGLHAPPSFREAAVVPASGTDAAAAREEGGGAAPQEAAGGGVSAAEPAAVTESGSPAPGQPQPAAAPDADAALGAGALLGTGAVQQTSATLDAGTTPDSSAAPFADAGTVVDTRPDAGAAPAAGAAPDAGAGVEEGASAPASADAVAAAPVPSTVAAAPAPAPAPAAPLRTPGGAPAGGVVSVVALTTDPSALPGVEPAAGRDALPRGGSGAGYSLPCIATIFEYIISWIGSDKPEEVVFGLELGAAALNAGGAAFERHKVLMDLVVEHLCHALFEASHLHNLSALSGLCQCTLALYCHLRRHLLLQLEAVVGLGLLRIAEGRGRVEAPDMQETALEALLDLVAQPGFCEQLYANADCRIERANVFEALCSLLSKTAFPVNCPLSTVHLLSLKGLLAILSNLTAHADAAGMSGGPHAPELSSYEDPEGFRALWGALVEGQPPPAFGGAQGGAGSWVDCVRREKCLKGRLAVAADMFNRDHKKGFQFLHSLGLLQPEDAAGIAQFLRCCPGLSKRVVGELLGESDELYLAVLDTYTKTFDFTSMNFDVAIRTYLETFRLPGEAQKINRIMESFGKAYHAQASGVFQNSDAVYVLAYSVIMLNTDLHNEQVKTKMTLEQFIRNNRGINGGEDLPPELLKTLYDSIKKNEITIYHDAERGGGGEPPAGVSPVFWPNLMTASRTPRGAMLMAADGSDGPATTMGLQRDMFSLIWGPALAAVSVVLDHSADMGAVGSALEGVKLVARMAAYHQVDQVMDSLVVSLAKYTQQLNPSAPKPTVVFGDDPKARAATETIFFIANTYGNHLRSGWKTVVDVILRLHRLGLLPAAVFLLEASGEEAERAKARIPRPPLAKRASSTGNLLSRAISSLISIDSSEGAAEPSSAEVEATQRTLLCVEACCVDEVIADSKFLIEPSLRELAGALRAAAGPVPPKPGPGGTYELQLAEVCLELLLTLALRNRDRLGIVWPLLHELLAAICDERAFKAPNPLVKRAVFGLLRVCVRLLPYKEECGDALLRSLKLICRLNANVAWDLAEQIGAEVLALLRSSAGHIRSADGWHTVCLLLTTTSIHPGAADNVLQALQVVTSDESLPSPINFGPVLDTATRFVDQYSKDASPQRSVQALGILEGLYGWLLYWSNTTDMPPPGAAGADLALAAAAKADALAGYWWSVVSALAKYAQDEGPALRNAAIEALKRVLTSSDALGLPAQLWVAAVDECLAPMTGELAGFVSSKARTHPEADKSLRLAVTVLTKTVLQYMPLMLTHPDFPEMWAKVLVVLQGCTRNSSEALAEAVPEAVKNMLLVMATKEILAPDWTDAAGRNLWDLTWSKAKTISSGLTPQLLASSGIPGFEPPPAQPEPSQPAGASAPTAAAAPSPDAATPAALGEAFIASAAGDARGAAAGSTGEAASSSAGAIVESPEQRRDVLMVNDTTDGSVSVTSYEVMDEPEDAAAAAAAAGEGAASGEEGGGGGEGDYSQDAQAKQAAACKQS